ncbi:hypothetical protein Zmor_010922 [Zophobas morio]|uniref:Uncharacterized protein n=1 Tax=Zophobas morio TaxID=2755281 RepID=A0AA38IQ12_9CUCU|nr:hypothetical protein Zmor_010922 [Zophobas morio]
MADEFINGEPQVWIQVPREPGHFRIVRTEERGRPREEFNQVLRFESINIELSEFGLFSEIPIRKALNDVDMNTGTINYCVRNGIPSKERCSNIGRSSPRARKYRLEDRCTQI